VRNFIGTKVSRIGEITDLPVEEFRGAGRAFVERHGRSLKMRRAPLAAVLSSILPSTAVA